MAAYFCPHCKVRSVFAGVTTEGVEWDNTSHLLMRCQNCEGIVYARFPFEVLPDGGKRSDPPIFYPEIRSEAPEDYPLDVRENFSEALRSLNVNNPRAAVIMTRSALQAAMREHEARGGSLNEEIEDLAARHVLPESLKDWAHELRDGGNLVAHPEPGKHVEMQDAKELSALAESIFEYMYVIPKELDRRRQRLTEQTETPTEGEVDAAVRSKQIPS